MFRRVVSKIVTWAPHTVANNTNSSVNSWFSISRHLSPISSSFHTSLNRPDLMEFFDEKENWGKARIRVGKSWSQDELRLKSNQDLHKLWYVLLKERNMLLTTEEAYVRANENMPNPERLDKVEESMENLEFVVRERNRAYFELETGDSGERERYLRPGAFGFKVGYTDREHVLPWHINSSYREKLRFRFSTTHGPMVKQFLAKYIEMLSRDDRKKRLVQMRRCANMLRRFPNANEEAIKEKYPLVDVGLVRRWKKSLSHEPNDHLDV